MRSVLRFAAFALFLALASLCRSAATSVAPALPPPRYQLPSQYARVIALSYDSLAADLLWIRYVQQMPDRPADPALGSALASQLHSIVDLDPEFRAAYLHGSILLSVLGNRPCDALEVLESGIRRHPEDWRLSFQAGYNCFAEIGAPECAARHMRRAAALPESPKWLPGLVARLLADSTQHVAAIEYLEAEIQRTKDARIKERLVERLAEATLAREFARIDAATREWRKQHGGEVPESLERLEKDGFLSDVPAVDPFGGHYVLVDGRAASTTGRKGLTAFKREGHLEGSFEERLLVESVVARLRDLGKPVWLWSEADAVAARGGLVDQSIQALEVMMPWVDADRAFDYRQLQARAMLRRDVDRLKQAWIALLAERSNRRPSIEEIAARAGVGLVDPFGMRYRLSAEGEPIVDPTHVALSPIIAGAQERELSKCR